MAEDIESWRDRQATLNGAFEEIDFQADHLLTLSKGCRLPGSSTSPYPRSPVDRTPWWEAVDDRWWGSCEMTQTAIPLWMLTRVLDVPPSASGPRQIGALVEVEQRLVRV